MRYIIAVKNIIDNKAKRGEERGCVVGWRAAVRLRFNWIGHLSHRLVCKWLTYELSCKDLTAWIKHAVVSAEASIRITPKLVWLGRWLTRLTRPFRGCEIVKAILSQPMSPSWLIVGVTSCLHW